MEVESQPENKDSELIIQSKSTILLPKSGDISPVSNVGEFWKQLKVLCWKNAILKLRNWSTLILELLLPVAIILALVAVISVLTPTESISDVPDGFYQIPPLSQVARMPPCTGFGPNFRNNLIWDCSLPKGALGRFGVSPMCPRGASENIEPIYNETFIKSMYCQRQYIAVAPDVETNTESVNLANDFIEWSNSSPLFNANLTEPTYKFFPSEAAILSVTMDPLYKISSSLPFISAAIIFKKGYPTWEYTLRHNMSKTMDTTSPAVDISIKSNVDADSFKGPFLDQYLKTGSFSLTNTLNSFVSTITCRKANKCTSDESVKLWLFGLVAFPNPKSSNNGFWGAVGNSFNILMIITLLYPISNMIKMLVIEKESKLREGMMMMSMRSDALWISWIINFIALLLPLSILLTIAGSKLFAYSRGQYIFLYFFVFFLSAMSYSIFMSIFFSKARTASIVGSLIFFSGWFINLGMTLTSTWATTTSKSTIMFASLHPACAFSFASTAFQEYEDSQIGITQYTVNKSATYPFTFQDMLGMMVIDFFYLLALAWYFSQVWPSEWGTQKKWYFLFQKSYWYKSDPSSMYKVIAGPVELGEDDIFVESVPTSLAAQVIAKQCIDIQNLYKEFRTNTGTKVAVDGLHLTMYQGQITALLGHNGAGKTTTISMLTGLIPADRGTATIEGYDLRTEMPAIRRRLGVCPQHDILFADLTVEEHLILFASFKGVSTKDMTVEVERMINAVGLTEKRTQFSKNLSGGQKRKLSVAIAFIGNSRIVILDEPTSGMDPYSRRFTWNIIRQHKEGRVVVLTTHFMDEADLLGDRIAIMGHGKLKCCGSSLYLKGSYGVGYNMTLEKKEANNFDSYPVESLVKRFISEATVLSDAGKELSFRLPFSATPHFTKLFSEIDDNLEKLNLRSYGMSVTTLEEVFLRVSQMTEVSMALQPLANKLEKVNTDVMAPDELKQLQTGDLEVGPKKLATYVPLLFDKLADDNDFAFFIAHMHGMINKRAYYFWRDGKAWVLQYVLPVFFVLLGLIIVNGNTIRPNQPLLTMSSSTYNKDCPANAILPFPYSNGDTFNVCRSTDQCSRSGIYKSAKNSNILSTIFFPDEESSVLNNTAVTSQSVFANLIPGSSNNPMIPINGSLNLYNMSIYLRDHTSVYQASTFGAVSFWIVDDGSTPEPNILLTGHAKLRRMEYFIHANYTAPHSSHIYNSLTVNGALRAFNSEASLTVNMHPLPNTLLETKNFASYNAREIVTFIMLAMPCIPAAFATFVVRERDTQSKRQQMVSGVSVPSYWLATFLWDQLSFQPTIWMIIILLLIFPKNEGLTMGGSFSYTVGLFHLFGMAIAGFAYFLSFVFYDAASAQIGLLFATFVLGLILSIVGIILRILYNKLYMSTIRYFFCLFPPFALADGLSNLILRNTWSVLELTGTEVYAPGDYNITGLNISFLGWESVVYLFLTILVDYSINTPAIQSMYEKIFINHRLQKLDEKFNTIVEDQDVRDETTRVASGEADATSVIKLQNVKKLYAGNKYAVKGVSIGIPNGECFGLLGINGAGKSTTLSILSGEFPPNVGDAYVAGLNLSTNVHTCRRRIGFCPQFDALFELLTGREHLVLYARIKGIAEKDIIRVVNGKIKEMALTEYADRAAGTYSGGNKRKLSVAIAMIGEPSIVFLDEPSTGMDPVARRFMWEVITDIVTKREKCSVILTTHSMEECEALCTRIGIMVGGKLRCLGPSQRLRSLYGHGFQLEVSYEMAHDELITELTKQIFPDLAINISEVSKAFVMSAIDKAGKTKLWANRLTPTGSGSDIIAALESSSGQINLNVLINWWFYESLFDETCDFFKLFFSEFTVRERQISKVRFEISAIERDGSPRKLGGVFEQMESQKVKLKIQDYAISQTSLEQIFNQFAAQQDEEQAAVIQA